ncbi:MAG: hypothetical protein Q9225_008023 [Loekoesia sp. 1 TL-2023]
MHLAMYSFIPFLPCLLLLTLSNASPTCADPPTENPPKLSDCDHVISHIQRQVAETGNPLYTASRRKASNIYVPIVYWDHLPESTCGVRLDMTTGKEDATDELRLSDIAYAAQFVMHDCLTPGNIAKLTEGWMRAGKNGFVNVTVEKLRWDLKAGERGGVLRLQNGTLEWEERLPVDV